MHIGNSCQVGKIKDSLVGLSIATHQPCTVNGKYNRQILNTHIVQDLVISSLQEGRVDCHHRLHASCCQPCRKGYRMLLRNSHIEESVFIHVTEPLKPCTVRHSGRNCHHFLITLPQLTHYSRENIRIIGHCSGMRRNTSLDIKRIRTMESCRMTFCRTISLALFGHHMNHDSAFHPFGFLNDPD